MGRLGEDGDDEAKAEGGLAEEVKRCAAILILACGCAIHTSRHIEKTITLRTGEKTSFGEGHRSFVQVLRIDHHRATVEVWNRDFRERVWIQNGEFAETTIWGKKAIKLLSIDGKKAVLEIQWAENY